MLRKTLLLAITTLYLSSNCQAAVSDAGTGEFNKKEQELYQEKTVLTQDNVVNKTAVGAEEQQVDNVVIAVSKIIVNKSEILSDEELRTITKKYEGQEIGLKDLYQVVAEINALYKKKSYITAKAILPPQKIENGIVTITLVEGRFGEFILDGNRHTVSSYINDRIPHRSGDLVKVDQLQKDIFYFNSTNDIQMKAELKPGKEVGTTDCILYLREPEVWHTTLFTDNAGRSESGLYRTGMVIENNSVFGNRESLVLNPTWTKGTMAGSIFYSIPMDNRGTRIGVSYSENQTEIISGTYQSMDIVGDSRDVGLTITHPYVVKEKRKADVFGEIHWKNSSTDFFGNTLLDSKVKTATIGSSERITDGKGVWYSQYSFTGISATQKQAYDEKNFWRFNLSAVRQQVLANERNLIWRLSAQLSDNSQLPSSEQFSLGGMSSVKGFTEGLLSGDQGYYIGLEYAFPLQFSKQIKGLVFIDHGSTYNSYENGMQSRDYLTSTGVGLIANFAPNYFGKVLIGFPLNSSKERDRTRIHFFLETIIK